MLNVQPADRPPRQRSELRAASHGTSVQVVVDEDERRPGMMVRRDPSTGQWLSVWPEPMAITPTAGTPSPTAVSVLTLPIRLGAQVGDRLLYEDRACELVRRCQPLEDPMRMVLRHLHEQFGERADEVIAVNEVWMTRPATPDAGPTTPLPATLSAAGAAVRPPR